MSVRVLLLLVLAGCVDQATVVDVCGPRPTAPGTAISTENINGYDRVLMTREAWNEIDTWKRQASEWMTCAESM